MATKTFTGKIYSATNIINGMIYIGQTTQSSEERKKNTSKAVKLWWAKRKLAQGGY